MRNKIVLLFVASFVALAQTAINGSRTITGIWDASGASRTAPAKAGTSLPGTCTVGDVYFKTDATAGQNLYFCTATNTWTQQSGGGGGGGVPSLLDTYANITGAANSNGQLGFPTSGTIQPLFRSTASAWQALMGSKVMPSWDETSFAWVNQGSATIPLDNGSSNPPKGSVIIGDGSAGQTRARLATSPANNTDWHVKLRFRAVWRNAGQAGLALRVSGTDAWWVYHAFSDSGDNNPRMRVVTYTSSAQGGGSARTSEIGFQGRDYYDLCIRNNSGTNNLEFKFDSGAGWQTMLTISNTTMGTVNQYGYYVSGISNQLLVHGLVQTSGDCAAF